MNDILCIGALNAHRAAVAYLVVVHYIRPTKEYRCTIAKNRRQIQVRTHATKQEFIDAYLPFFGQGEIDKVKFRE